MKAIPVIGDMDSISPAAYSRVLAMGVRLIKHPGLWIAVVVLLAGLVLAIVQACGPQVRTVLAQKKDLEQHLVASGRVWVPTRVQVSAVASGLVLAVAVTEGQHVRIGDLLVQMDDAEARAAVSQAEAAVNEARARVDQQQRVEQQRGPEPERHLRGHGDDHIQHRVARRIETGVEHPDGNSNDRHLFTFEPTDGGFWIGNVGRDNFGVFAMPMWVFPANMMPWRR